MAFIFALEFQGRSFLNYMGILLWNDALLVELSKIPSFYAACYPLLLCMFPHSCIFTQFFFIVCSFSGNIMVIAYKSVFVN